MAFALFGAIHPQYLKFFGMEKFTASYLQTWSDIVRFGSMRSDVVQCDPVWSAISVGRSLVWPPVKCGCADADIKSVNCAEISAYLHFTRGFMVTFINSRVYAANFLQKKLLKTCQDFRLLSFFLKNLKNPTTYESIRLTLRPFLLLAADVGIWLRLASHNN